MHLQTVFNVYLRYQKSYLRFTAQLGFVQLYYLAVTMETRLYESNTVYIIHGELEQLLTSSIATFTLTEVKDGMGMLSKSEEDQWIHTMDVIHMNSCAHV